MKLVLHGDTAFRAISSTALYERDYETILINNAPSLFADFHAVPFKLSMSGRNGAKKADFALIDCSYRGWWVVEVELAHHSFEGHVLPQVEVLIDADYGDEVANHLASQDSSLDVARLAGMVRGEPPSVLVIVNEPRPDWRLPLKALGASLLVVEVYRSELADHVLVADGSFPQMRSDLVSACRRHQFLRTRWVVEAPGALPAADEIAIGLDGRDTRWRVFKTADMVLLAPVEASDPLGAAATHVEIVEVDGHRFEFRDLR